MGIVTELSVKFLLELNRVMYISLIRAFERKSGTTQTFKKMSIIYK